MGTIEDAAVQLFTKRFNCAQSVFGAFCQQNGFESEKALKIASGFGGGLRSGEICGAVSGAVMAIGLKCGYHVESDLAQKGYCNVKTFEYLEKFKAENGSIMCRDLIGIDIREPDDHLKPEVREAHRTICPKIVASAARILERMDFELPR